MNKDIDKDEDLKLYNEYLSGNNESFEVLYNKYSSKIQYFIFNIVKDYQKSEDLTQEVFLYVLQNKLRQNASFKYYIYLVAKSKSLNYINKEKRRNEINEQYSPDEMELVENDIFDVIDRNENNRLLMESINMLDEKYKNAIYLVKIEHMSYSETAKILGETESNIKNLVHRGKKQLQKILLRKGFDNMSKFAKTLIILISAIVLLSGIVYATIKISENLNKNANLTPTFTGKLGDTNTNNIWVGTFQLAWNEFLDTRLNGKDLKFEHYESSLANELNKRSFTKDMLSDDCYYIKVSETRPELKTEIEQDLRNKFNFESTILNDLDFTKVDNFSKPYTLYSMLFKNFEFEKPFDKLSGIRFKDSDTWYKSFGIENSSSEDLNSNVEVLYYNRISDSTLMSDDFAVKLKTTGNDEVILCRTDSDDSFDKIFEEIGSKSEVYTGKREFQEDDELKIPYINVDTVINYDELCGKFIEGTNGLYLMNAMQNVKFSLNEKGGNLTSEAGIQDMYLSASMDSRFFYLNDNFILFLKEKDADKPYFALRITNTDLLTQIEY